MTCNCKSEIEAKLLESFKAGRPDAQGHKAVLEGYGFAVVDNVLTLRPFMPIKYGAGHASKKSGLERWRNEKGFMQFSFCPFCGTRIATKENTL